MRCGAVSKRSLSKLGKKNPMFGKTLSREHREKLRKSMLSEKNPNWAGDKVGYAGVHLWIKRHYSRPKFCEICNDARPQDLASKAGKYTRDKNNFEWLCRRCHMKKDGRLKNLINGNKTKRERKRDCYGRFI